MNKVELIGRISQDIDVKTSQAGKSYLNFSVAIDRKYKDQSGNKITDFLNCKAFGKTSEFIGQYFSKGDKIALIGSVQVDNYTDQQGNKKSFTYIQVDEVESVEGKKQTVAEQAPASPSAIIPEPSKKVQASLDFFDAQAAASDGQLPFEL